MPMSHFENWVADRQVTWELVDVSVADRSLVGERFRAGPWQPGYAEASQGEFGAVLARSLWVDVQALFIRRRRVVLRV
jgi:hypothetical protein